MAARRLYFFVLICAISSFLWAAPAPAPQTVQETFFHTAPWYTLDKDAGETIRRLFDSASMQGSTFAWGGYNAGTGHAVAIDNQTITGEPGQRSRLTFNQSANTSGSFAYTRFDTTSADFNSGAGVPSLVVDATKDDSRIELDVLPGGGEQVAMLIRDNAGWWQSSAKTMPTVTSEPPQTVSYVLSGANAVTWTRVNTGTGGNTDIDQVDNGGEGPLALLSAGAPNMAAIEGMGVVVVTGGPGNTTLSFEGMRLIGNGGTTPPPPTDKTIMRLHAPAWRNIGGQSAQEVAKKFTIIYGHLSPTPFHQGNPDAKCVKYYLGPYVGNYLKDKFLTERPGALARDAQGNPIKARDWANWLIVPDNEEWIEYHIQDLQKFFTNNPGWDGIFEDSMGTAPIEGNYLLADPINPNTGKVYTKKEWLEAEQVMLQRVRQALPAGKLLTMNGLANSSRYWTTPETNSPRMLLPYVDSAMAEMIWRGPEESLTAWPSLSEWNSTINMIKDVDSRGVIGCWWTKMWGDGNTSNDEPNAATLIPQWRRLTLASTLLAAGPKTYYNFDTEKNDNNAAEPFPEYNAPLGWATGVMTQLNVANVYGRPFSGGLVLVNPTGSTANNVTIPWTQWKNKNLLSAGEGTKTYKEPFTIPAHTGLILTGQSAAADWKRY